MKTAIQDVADFHIACDQPVRVTPQLISSEETLLRKRLIKEETEETLKAMDSGDLVEIADGLADIMYVVIGTAHHYGIPLAAVWNEVQRSNMTKPDPTTGKALKRDDGKILKGPWFSPADIGKVLLVNGWGANGGNQ